MTVNFNPMSGTKTTGAAGVTGPDGKYQLTHRSGQLGIEPGQYSVTFSRLLADGKPVPTLIINNYQQFTKDNPAANVEAAY